MKKNINIRDIVEIINIWKPIMVNGTTNYNIDLNDKDTLIYVSAYFNLTKSLGIIDENILNSYYILKKYADKANLTASNMVINDEHRTKLVDLAYQYFEDFKGENNALSRDIFYNLCVLENRLSSEDEVNAAKVDLEDKLSCIYGGLEIEENKFRQMFKSK